MSNPMIRTRFAPSPTGFLHIGGVRTALFSWLYAKKHQGKFLLRIEDTDRKRSTKEAVESIIDGLSWLGLQGDAGTCYQSKNFNRHREVMQKLLDQGKAYRCYCSAERLQKLRDKQMANKEKPRYDSYCRKLTDSERDVNKPHVIRFKNPEHDDVLWQDAVKGEIKVANKELDDLIIWRSNNTPTYNFCVVIDDMDMGITHVVRGDDHINNTPRQINLYRALEAQIPIFAHVPMILAEDGKKLSKRHGAVSVTEYRNQGYLPQALINYLLRLGWSYGDKEIFTIDEILPHFDLKDINNAPAIFNLEKLNWLNQYYMRNLPVSEVARHLQWHFGNAGLDVNNGPAYHELIPVMAEKVKTLKALAEASRYFYTEFDDYDKKAFEKHLTAKAIEPLKQAQSYFAKMDSYAWQDSVALHNALKQIASALGLGMGKVGMPIRVAVTGSAQSPEIGLTLKWLGKERVITRLERAINAIEQKNIKLYSMEQRNTKTMEG